MRSNKPKIVRSNEIYERAKDIIPAGSQTFSKGVTQFVDGFAPKYLAKGNGCKVWDVDGNQYLGRTSPHSPRKHRDTFSHV